MRDSTLEIEKFHREKELRELNVKKGNDDVSDPRVLQKGFISLQ
jgi:hypothetical protein